MIPVSGAYINESDICDYNEGIWNHSLKICDFSAGIGGKMHFIIRIDGTSETHHIFFRSQ